MKLAICLALVFIVGCQGESKSQPLLTKSIPSLGMIQLTGASSFREGHAQLIDPNQITSIEGGRSMTTVCLGEHGYVHVLESPSEIARVISEIQTLQKLKKEQE